MSTPHQGATALTLHPDWDTDRAQEHLADLRRQIDRSEAVVEALTEHLSSARREVDRLTGQLHSSETLFSQPRHARQPPPDAMTDPASNTAHDLANPPKGETP